MHSLFLYTYAVWVCFPAIVNVVAVNPRSRCVHDVVLRIGSGRPLEGPRRADLGKGRGRVGSGGSEVRKGQGFWDFYFVTQFRCHIAAHSGDEWGWAFEMVECNVVKHV